MTSLHDAALEWATAGASIVPTRTDGSKSPYGSWKQYQTNPATINQLNDWFTTGAFDGLGVITGAVSGQLEMLEVEARAAHLLPELVEQLTNCGHHDLWAAINQGCVEATPSGGIHWHYRVSGGPAKPNTKLASRPNDDGTVDVLFETRGEGGFTILAPSNGRTHPTGRPWTRMGGAPASIPTITVDQRDTLHGIIRTLFDQAPPIPAPRTVSHNPLVDGTRPGDDYNTRASWDDLLAKHGWTKTRPVGPSTGWVRPGKNPREGVSATTRETDTGDWLYVFTTSTVFTAETPYSKFSALALLEYGGDHSAAAAALRREGYGGDRPFPVVTTTPTPQLATAADTATGGSVATATLTPALHAATGELEDVDLTYQRGTLSAAVQADIVARALRGHFLWCKALGWLRWDGKRWDGCTDEELVEQIRRHQKLTVKDAISKGASDDDLKKIVGLLSDGNIRSVERLMRGVTGITVRNPNELDADPNLLNCANGTLDLTTRTLRPHDPADRITKVTRAAYRADTDTSVWDAFLAQVVPNRDELDYLRRVFGVCAYGRVREHLFPILTGTGANGKGTTYGAIVFALGDYATVVNPEMLMARERATGHADPEMMTLRGARLAVGSEVEEGRKLDAATMKRLTGGDQLTSRHLFKDQVTWQPTHQIVYVTNKLPEVKGNDPAVWRRIRVVPFDVVLPEKDWDLELPARLELHADAVLSWIVEGYFDGLDNGGMRAPESVTRATGNYQDESDDVAQFVKNRCNVGRHHKATTRNLHRAYKAWAEAEGGHAVTEKAFAKELDRLEFYAKKENTGHFRQGIDLMTSDELEEAWEAGR